MHLEVLLQVPYRIDLAEAPIQFFSFFLNLGIASTSSFDANIFFGILHFDPDRLKRGDKNKVKSYRFLFV